MEDYQETMIKMRNGVAFANKTLMPALKEIEYISEHAEILFEDANENTRILGKMLKKNGKKRQVVTRNTIRSSCACVEGFAYVLKHALKMTIDTTPPELFNKKQREFINGEFLNGSGAENYKLALKCFAKKYNIDVSQMFGTQEFEQLQQAFELRNRLMHPKSSDDLHVTFDDARLLSSAIVWFIHSQHEVFNQIYAQIEKQADELLVV
ncbi:hypothetical protein OL322_004073 [Vibrio vulnificus]|nr:hypothetical protein [Vibrio vulnificus]EKA7356535.1 hypothetical protein [Vibrio vulnificus]